MSRRRGIREITRDVINALRGRRRISEIDAALSTAMDSDPLAYQRSTPTTFSLPAPFGARDVSDDNKLFASQREPIIKWLTYWVAVDIFDNWFEVIDPENPDDKTLDMVVQRVLRHLDAKEQLIRLFNYERRYGTAILLCSYTGFKEDNWTTPIYEGGDGLNLPNPETFQGKGTNLLQITPYPWSKVTVTKAEDDDSNLRYSLPQIYKISRSIISEQGATATQDLEVHWSRVIHAATRLDENSYEGESVVDAVWDDATGGRNLRWAAYETMFRVGSGFPHFKFPWATREQISRWIASGEITNLNARGYFVSGQEGEDVEFIGPQGVSLDPKPYFEMWIDSLAMATRIPKDMLKGVSAGTVAGSEVNERSYWNFISSEQALVEPIIRELIDRLIDTGQIHYADRRRSPPRRDYHIKWHYPQIVSERDRAQIDFLQARGKSEMLNWLTVNELREREGLDPLEEGDVVLGILKQTRTFQEREGTRPTPEERRPPEQPEEETRET